MVCCCIYGCSNNSNKNKGVGFYLIPKIISWQCSKTYNLSSERRSLWLQRINRHNFNEKTIEGSRVCGAHFVLGKPAALFDKNNSDWAPSLDLGYEEGEELEFRRGRWIKRKKKKIAETESVKKTETFIMLDNLECTSDTLKLLKKKSKIILDDASAAGCSQDITESKNTDIKNTIICNKNRKSRTRKDMSCQTDIKSEYIGHLETHVVYLRDEVQNLKQQIEQYEAYYQMMAGNDAKNHANLVKNNILMSDNNYDESEPQPKRYKPMSNYSEHNNEESQSDDDYSPLIPQVVMKLEPEDNEFVLPEEETKEDASEDENINCELSPCQEKLNDNTEKDDSDKCLDAKQREISESDCSIKKETAVQVRKSSRPRKSMTAFDGTKIVIESASVKSTSRVTAYSLWAKERRAKIAKEHPDMEYSGVTKFLSEMWKEVPKDEKLVWQIKAKSNTSASRQGKS